MLTSRPVVCTMCTMLDLPLAGSANPRASTLGPRTETEPPLGQVGHVVCDHEDHAHLRDLIAEHFRVRSFGKAEYADWFDALDDIARDRLETWLDSARPWPDAGLTIGECGLCHSSITTCLACHDELIVEDESGSERPCACNGDALMREVA